jgi:hypothetical protein
MLIALILAAGLRCTALPPFPEVPVVATVVVTATPESANTPAATPTSAADSPVGVDQVTVTDTVVVTFTVASSQAILFDAPLLDGERPRPESLEAAHVALLDLALRGQATATLEFPIPASDAPWMLVFNPLHEPGDYVAPRVEIEVRP